MSRECECEGCCEEAEYICPFGNFLCETHMQQDMEEMMNDPEDYEKITSETKCINLNT